MKTQIYIYHSYTIEINTPRDTMGSPVQSLMSRRTKPLIPTHEKLLIPKVIELVQQRFKQLKKTEKKYADIYILKNLIKYTENKRMSGFPLLFRRNALNLDRLSLKHQMEHSIEGLHGSSKVVTQKKEKKNRITRRKKQTND